MGDECDRLERWVSVSQLGLRGFELATRLVAVVVARPSEGSLPPPTSHHRSRPDQAHCQGLAAAQTPAPGTQALLGLASPMTSLSFVQLFVQSADSRASSGLQPWAGSVKSRHCSPVSAAESLCDWTRHLCLEAQDTGVPLDVSPAGWQVSPGGARRATQDSGFEQNLEVQLKPARPAGPPSLSSSQRLQD